MTAQNVITYNKRIAAQVGAGLSFPLAAVLFLASGEWLYFALIPAGAVMGMAVGAFLAHLPALSDKAAQIGKTVQAAGAAALSRFEDERLLVRVALLFALSIVLFLAAWTVAYAFLPEKLLAGNGPLTATINETVGPTLWDEWQRIVTANLPWVVGIALLNLLLGYPYAALVPVAWVVFYAVFLGTNSFGISMAAPMAPSLAVLERAGPYEIGAYLFVAAATYPLSQIALPWRKVDEGAQRNVPWRQIIVGLLLSALVIMLAGWREAEMIFTR